ncbi:RNA polymerase sigma-70 factor, ECF subfamily [bacterium A37T11]|nr:RNA polymerase sigma-70 factor, ECF subfamily [bacterium A37T11]
MDNKLNNRQSSAQLSDAADDALHLLFTDIFRSYEKPLSQLALKLCKDPVATGDILQDVFLKLWELRSQIHEIENMEAFLYTLTRNKVMDFLRKTATDERLKQAIWEAMQGVVQAPDPGVELKEFQDVLARAIDQLPPQRKAIYLLREQGYNYQEIADKMSLSRHTVKNQVSSSLQSIRYVLKNIFPFQ